MTAWCSFSYRHVSSKDKPIKNADEAAVNSAALRLQSDMQEAVGATNLGNAVLTQQFLAKASKKDAVDGLDGSVFSSSLARVGGLKAFADQLKKDCCAHVDIGFVCKCNRLRCFLSDF